MPLLVITAELIAEAVGWVGAGWQLFVLHLFHILSLQQDQPIKG